MRTTLTLDDDLLQRLREEAARTRRRVHEVLNEKLRLGFSAGAVKTKPMKKFKVVPFKTGGFMPGIDELKLNQLADTLENEHILQKIRKGK